MSVDQEKMEQFSCIGHSVPKIDALDKVLGRALYAEDISFPNMLYGRVLRAGVPHAVIEELDTSKAKAMKGVMCILTARDIPGVNRYGIAFQDQVALADRFGDSLRALIDDLVRAGSWAVITCSALKESYRQVLRVDGDEAHFVYLRGTYQLIKERLERRRDHFMPAGLLASQFEALEEPGGVLTIDVSQRPDAIIRAIRSGLRV